MTCLDYKMWENYCYAILASKGVCHSSKKNKAASWAMMLNYRPNLR
jgi:hypothetical protein